MFVGVVASRTGCSVELIRHYEKIGLLNPTKRTATGYRVYGEDDLRHLKFIRNARSLGFGLTEIRELLDLSETTEDDCKIVDAIAARHLDSVRRKVLMLTAMAEELEQVTSQCKGGSITKCEILSRLAADTLTDGKS